MNEEAKPPSLTRLANAPGKLPPLPTGKPQSRARELGDTLDWGDGESNHPSRGVPHAIAVIAMLTKSDIEPSGLTVEEALAWASAYEREAERNPRNVSAGPRAQLLRCIARILASTEAGIIGAECCPDELLWRHPRRSAATR